MAKKKQKSKVWHWSRGSRLSSMMAPEVAGEELERIRRINEGELEPEAIVKESRPKGAVLHSAFEWNLRKAAHEHHLEQARLISRSVWCERDETPGQPSRMYETTRSLRKPNATVYKPVEEIMQDPEARAELLQQALGALVAARRKYSLLQELAIVFRAIDEVLETVKI